jgi:hypothetical protein
MWHDKSARERLKENILEQVSKSLKRRYDVEKYARDYAYGLKLGIVKPCDPDLIKDGKNYVHGRIEQEIMNSKAEIP